MTVQSVRTPGVPEAPTPGATRAALVSWFAGFAALTFAVPLIATDWMELQHDLYYLMYGTLVMLYVAVFVSWVPTGWRRFVRHNLSWSIALGVLIAVASVRNVLSDASTARPSGAFFGFELAWRGVFYGLIDALALLVFPALVAFLLMGSNRRGVGRKVAFAALTLLLTLTVTATYHLGYPQFRNSDLANPETGALLMSVPAMLTGNPVGALIAHPAMHVTAVAHEYEGHDPGYLPPKLSGYADRWGGTLAWVLAALWLGLVGAVVWLSRRSLFGHKWNSEPGVAESEDR